jgi:hypothetical protein
MAVTIDNIGVMMGEPWKDPNEVPVATYAGYGALALGGLFFLVCIALVVFEVRQRVLVKRQQTPETLAGIAETKAVLKYLYPAVLFLLIIVIILSITWHFTHEWYY